MILAISSAMFGAAWVLLVAVAILLDWLGNPQRGRFRPAGGVAQNRAERRALKRSWEDERDRRNRAALAASPTRRERRRQQKAAAAAAADLTAEETTAVARALARMNQDEQDRGHERAHTP
ncbi:MAG: hypothetical protein MUE34_03320 [Acidimicrobiales bacterium]|jgi:hypothetical protein|nr:hypothetical protein [Acidimicrobiales bacterium]